MGSFREVLCASGRTALLATLFTLAAASVPAAPADEVNHSGCHLGGGIRHVVEIQFDNLHLRRDSPDVPSDLEQMPRLLGFLRSGTLLTNHHTPLISHTADDIITTLTGNYGEKHGQSVANSYGYFRADGSVGFSSSFGYWTDPAPDGTPQMIDPRGKTHPAPWVPFTRAGCDVGAFAMANIGFENVSGDIDTVFGPGSFAATEAANNFDKAVADFEGIAVHCARNSRLCGYVGAPDLLPDEPGGYQGFSALYGNYSVAPQITRGETFVDDIDGKPINDGHGNVGFPGFHPSAAQTLGYLAQMLEAGVPVVYGYIADAHDSHFTLGHAAQLAAYDESFGRFFARLRADGITAENTLFIITAEENDHFVRQAGRGEVGVDLRQLLLSELGNSTAFAVHSDDAPTVYVPGQPAATAAVTRTLERDLAALVAFDPATGSNPPLMQRMADPAEMAFLHMVTHDPARTPTLTFFGNDDFFISAASSVSACTPLAACSSEQTGFNRNHGDSQRSISRTWLALIGPHVRRQGETNSTFTDHTDVRPTLLHLSGLRDDYAHDGRVILEALDDEVPQREILGRLAAAYKQINAPRGELGHRTLMISTRALAGDDATYNALEEEIASVTAQRNTIAGRMITMLEGAAFDHQRIDEDEAQRLIDAAQRLIASVR